MIRFFHPPPGHPVRAQRREAVLRPEQADGQAGHGEGQPQELPREQVREALRRTAHTSHQHGNLLC